MEAAACRLLVPLTLLVLVPVAAAIAADEEAGYVNVEGNKHKHRVETMKSTGTGTDEDEGHSDVVGNKYKHESETKKATNIADFDAVWRKRAEEAQKAAFDAYNPHPEKVTNSLNKKVKGSFESPTPVKHANEIKEDNKTDDKVGGKKDKEAGKKKEDNHKGKKEDNHKGKKKEDNHKGKEEREKHEGKVDG